MEYTVITSRSNDRIKQVCRLLRSASARKESRAFVLEGLRLCRDAAENGLVAEELYLTRRAQEKFPADVQTVADSAKAVYRVEEDVFAKMSETESSQGFLSVLSTDTLAPELPLFSNGRYVACENVADPSNLGAIARTAEALGVDGMLLFGACCDRFNPKALRASMGALLRLPMIRYPDGKAGMAALSALGLETYATVVAEDAEPIHQAGFHPGCVVFIGNEANGLTPEMIDACQRRITIPIAGRSESFNAAAAAAIVLWELMKA